MKVLIVDDDVLVSSSLKTIIESDSQITVCGIGHNGKEAIDLYKQLKPDILLMDIRMNEMTGVEAAEFLTKYYPDIKILFLTTFADDEYIIKALEIGAKGYIIKQNFESILPSIKAVYAGQTVFGEYITTKLPQFLKENKKNNLSNLDLSDKDYSIIKLIAEGLNNKEISQRLYISEGTVRNNISSILEKLNLRDRTQIAIYYYKNM